MREADIAIDAEQGTARGTRIGDEIWGNFVQGRGKIGDKSQRRLANGNIEFFLMLKKPVTLVVAFQTGKKRKRSGVK